MLSWLKQYRRELLAGDMTAGIIVVLMMVPQGMAYALVAGLPPVAGLYASLLPAVAYALFGSSMVQSVGPMAITSLMTATSLAGLAPAGSELYSAMAAQMTLMEMTYNPDIIFPGLLAITVANICHRELFSQPSAIGAVLHHQGIDLHLDPVSQALQRVGVSSLMNTNVVMGRATMPVVELQQLLTRKPDWIVLVESNIHYLADTRRLTEYLDSLDDTAPEKIDLLETGLATKIAIIDTQANVNEAWQIMLMTGNNAVCVRSKHQFILNSNIGVITRKALETHIYRRYGANS